MTRKHSTGLKLFIFLIVAMMLFSAIGVVVIYLNNPNQVMPVPTTFPTEPTNVTIPSVTPEVIINEGENNEDIGIEITVGDEGDDTAGTTDDGTEDLGESEGTPEPTDNEQPSEGLQDPTPETLE